MTDYVRCDACDTKLLSFEALGQKPIGREDCPNCGNTSFVESGGTNREVREPDS